MLHARLRVLQSRRRPASTTADAAGRPPSKRPNAQPPLRPNVQLPPRPNVQPAPRPNFPPPQRPTKAATAPSSKGASKPAPSAGKKPHPASARMRHHAPYQLRPHGLGVTYIPSCRCRKCKNSVKERKCPHPCIREVSPSPERPRVSRRRSRCTAVVLFPRGWAENVGGL